MEAIIICVGISTAIALIWGRGISGYKDQSVPNRDNENVNPKTGKFNIMP